VFVEARIVVVVVVVVVVVDYDAVDDGTLRNLQTT
jgi:hypothetical protein